MAFVLLCIHVLEFLNFDIWLYKSELSTLEPCDMYLVGIYWLSDDAGAQVAIIYSHLDPMWSLDVLGQVMY